ncbi:MAG: hypothetical protein ACK41E_04895 [Deinococcales bacterium]
MIFVAILGFSSLAGAQRFSIGGGISGSAGSDIVSTLTFSINLTVEDLARVGPIGVDARAELEGALFGNALTIGVNAAALATFGVSNFTLYGGPSVFLPVVPSGALQIGAIVGARTQIALGLSAYGELKLRFVNPLYWRLGFGLQYTF